MCERDGDVATAQNAFTPDFRRQIVEQVRVGRSVNELAHELKCPNTSVRKWVRQADEKAGRTEKGLTNTERAELRRLRREVRELCEERELLANAAIWFAREAGWARGTLSRS